MPLQRGKKNKCWSVDDSYFNIQHKILPDNGCVVSGYGALIRGLCFQIIACISVTDQKQTNRTLWILTLTATADPRIPPALPSGSRFALLRGQARETLLSEHPHALLFAT